MTAAGVFRQPATMHRLHAMAHRLIFMAFVDKLHGEGIGVILDWVPSNFPTDDFGLARFDGSPLYESNDPKTSKRDSWGTCLFNYARFEVTSFSCFMRNVLARQISY